MLANSIGISGMFFKASPRIDGFAIYTYQALIAVLFVTVTDLVTTGISLDLPETLDVIFVIVSKTSV